MSFITDRMRIDAKAAITLGNAAVETQKQNPMDQAIVTAYGNLWNAREGLNTYYDKHWFLGKIVKFFDTHSIFGHFNKYNKIDALLGQLKIIHDIAVKQGVIPGSKKIDLKQMAEELQKNNNALPVNHPLYDAWQKDMLRWKDLPPADKVDETQFMYEVHLYSAKLMPKDHPYFDKWKARQETMGEELRGRIKT